MLPTGGSLPSAPGLRSPDQTTSQTFSWSEPPSSSQSLTTWTRSRLAPSGSRRGRTMNLGEAPAGADRRSPPIGTPRVWPVSAKAGRSTSSAAKSNPARTRTRSRSSRRVSQIHHPFSRSHRWTDQNGSTGTSSTDSVAYRNGALDLPLLLLVQGRVGTEVFHLGAQYLAVELEGSLIVVLDSNG